MAIMGRCHRYSTTSLQLHRAASSSYIDPGIIERPIRISFANDSKRKVVIVTTILFENNTGSPKIPDGPANRASNVT
jgi:hypothetical protein